MILYLLASLALRMIGFTSSPIWYDEAVSLYRAQSPLTVFNLWEIILRLFAHGPLWLFRLPALLCSMIALWIAWLIMDLLKFTHRQRITACIFMAAFPGLLWMAQDARYYAAITALSMGTLYLALRRHWAFGFTFGLMFTVHPTAPAYGIAAFVIAWIIGMDYRRWIAAALLGISIMIAHAQIAAAIAQRTHLTSSPFWLAPLNTAESIYSIVQAFFVNTLPPLFMIAALAWLIFILAHAYLHPMDPAALILIIPLTIILLVSIVYRNVLFYRTLMPLAIPLALYVGSAFGENEPFNEKRIIPAIGLILVLSGLMHYSPAARGYFIEHAATRISDEWRDGDLIVYESGLTALPFDHYLHGYNACVRSQDQLPAGYPLAVCGYEDVDRQWIITSTTAQRDGILFERLWPWQVTPIEIHLMESK